MRVAYITAGAAGMYCGSCLHDNALAAAMIRAGHDVALIPVYTPIRTDEEDVSVDRVFYGAINVFLEQKSALFRHTPWLVDRMLNSRSVLDWATRHTTSVDAKELGQLTLSVLEGEDGRQKKELDKLVVWLRDEVQPDVVNLPNSMLLGLAHRLREELGVPVLCALQGEDIFLDELAPTFRERVSRLLRAKARDVDGFFAHSRYYVGAMAEMLDVARERFHLVRLGIHLDGHGVVGPADEGRPFTVGYLARICPEKGLHVLVEAFQKLAGRVGAANVRLRVAGYLGPRDRDYKRGILEQLAAWGLSESVDDLGEVDRERKLDFLRSIDVLSVPTTYREPKGLYVLEAMANHVPVVQPRHGAFPELLDATGGGLLVEPNDTDALADALER
ncbi:MAG TPA: glycosyltransferase family 4 protein, partial [Candidatus Polarisedimenticolaceae bacterium]|nr:glycosyltransferase family 4 protein [Candidatus Polarisedimenticolaceae bacterium]